MASQTTAKGLVCPHCNQAIPRPMMKSLNSIKNCPSCHKGVRYRKPEFKKLLPAILICFPIVAVLWVVFFMMGVSPAISGGIGGGVMFFIMMPFLNKHSRFDKTE